MKHPVFVVSTGRAGSQMLAHVLRLHPEVCGLHEPHPQLNVEAFAKWSGRVPRHRLLRRIKNKRADLIRQIGANGLVYFESAHFCAHLISELAELFDARFIHVHRDGLAFIRSGLRRGWYSEQENPERVGRVKAWLGRKLTWEIGNPGLLHRLEPPSELESRFDRIAWLWAEINSTILEAFSHLPESNKMSIRLADFGREHLERIHAFIGVDGADYLERMLTAANERPNRSEPNVTESYSSWTKGQLERYRALAGAVALRLGYRV